MTDITDRLRAAVPKLDGIPVGWRCEVRSELLLEAAAEVERLRANLRECACDCSSIRVCESECSKADYCLHWNARSALEAKP